MPGPRGYPRNLKELVVHLAGSPDVLFCRPGRLPARRRFVSYERGGLWFSLDGEVEPSSYLPVHCGRVASETGIDFDAAGFTLTKFGIATRVEYSTDRQ